MPAKKKPTTQKKSPKLVKKLAVKLPKRKPKIDKKHLKSSSGTRMLIRPEYKSFRLHKKIKAPQPKVISGYKILKKSFVLLKERRRPIAGILAIYLILSVIFVKGFSTTLDLAGVKDVLGEFYSGFTGQATSTFALFSLLVGSSGATSAGTGASTYQSLLVISLGLATVWTLRQGIQEKIRVRDGFYNGFYPLIPLILVICVIGIQLVPFAIASWAYNTVILGGIAATAPEQFVWGALILLLMLVSAYMLISSLFAVIIVTLPGIAPMNALRSARQLVRHRRALVLRKLLFLPLSVLLIASVVMLPFLVWLPQVAEWVFFVLTGGILLIMISYLYSLYIELLNE